MPININNNQNFVPKTTPGYLFLLFTLSVFVSKMAATENKIGGSVS
jgi:hypothetical protein